MHGWYNHQDFQNNRTLLIEMDLNPDAFERILTKLNDGLYFVDRQRVITYWNKGAERITGFPKEEVLGKSCADNILNHVDSEGRRLCLGLCPLARTIQDEEDRVSEVFLHHKDGHRVPVLVRTSVLTDENGEVLGGVELFTDISSYTATQQRIKELERMALLDPLTQLANRGYLERALQTRFEEFQRYGVPFGVLFLDIDHFKTFNDTYGHAFGDDVLAAVSRTIAANTRPFDLFGRWGGEEFLGIVRHVQLPELIVLGERLRALIHETYLVRSDGNLQVSVSIGAAAVQEGDTPNSLVERADRLMYKSKKEGRNRLSAE